MPPDFQRIFETAPGLFLVLARDAPRFTIVAASDAYLAAVQKRRDQLVGRAVFEAFPVSPEGTGAEKALRASFARAIERRVPDVVPVQRHDFNPAAEGSGLETRCWRALNTPVLDEKGEVLYLIHRVEEVTGNVRPGEHGAEPREPEALLRSVINDLPQTAVYQLEAQPKGVRHFTYFSDAVTTLFGCTPEQAIADARVVYERFAEEDRERLAREEEKALRALEPFRTEARLRAPSGETSWIYAASAPRRRSDGTVIWDGIVVDITERKRAEESLREREQFLDGILGSITDVFHTLDAGWRYSFVNEAAAKAMRMSADQVLGRNMWELFPDTVGNAAWVALHRAMAERVTVEYEVFYPAWQRWYRGTAYPRKDGGLAVFARDVTALKNAEYERESTVTFLQIVHTARTTAELVEAAVTFFQQRSGCEAVGIRLKDGDDFPCSGEGYESVALVPLRVGGERLGLLQLSDRRKGVFSAESIALWERLAGYLAVAIARVRTGEALRESEQRLREAEALARAMNSVHEVLHSARDVDEIMRAALVQSAAALGVDSAAVSLRDERGWCLKYVHGFASEVVGARMKDDEERHAMLAIETGQPVVVNDAYNDPRVDREHMRKWGVRAVMAVPLLARGGPIGVAFFNHQRAPFAFRDAHVTFGRKFAAAMSLALDNAHLVASLTRSEQSLREADQRKNHFLAVLSHELRNPLAPIANSLYILDHAPAGGDQAMRAKQVIGRQVAHLSTLVNDLLDVTRIARNKVQLQRERLELNELVRRDVEDNRSFFDRAGVSLELVPSPRPIQVHADGTRVAQVVSNLLQNAAKFTVKGGRTRVSLDAENGSAIVRVADNGVGMSGETLARLFEPFMQADHTLDRSKGGLGLGLALVKGLVDLHGGSVSAHSEGIGKGTEFVVRLPLDAGAALEQGTSRPRLPRPPRRILIIEDNADAADSLREALELGDHEVVVAYDGPEGLAKARVFQPEVLLCDIGLPGMDGFEVARACRADPALRDVFLVALSGYALPDDLQRASEAGFERHLAKPPSLEKLEELLSSLSGSGRTASVSKY